MSGHDRSHTHAPASGHARAFATGIALNTAFVAAELGFGLRAHSLALVSDAVVSLGVVATGIAMQSAGWLWLDPVVSIAIAVIITVGTWGLLRESMDLAIDAVPVGIKPLDVESYLAALHFLEQ